MSLSLCPHGYSVPCMKCMTTDPNYAYPEIEQLDGELLKIKKPEPGRCFCNNVGSVYVETDRDSLEAVACPFCVARGLDSADQQTLKALGQKIAKIGQVDPGQRKVSFEED